MERAHLTALQREQRNRVAIVANELYFKGRTAAMHQDGSAHVAVQQSVFWQFARQDHRVQFGHGLAAYCRVTPPHPCQGNAETQPMPPRPFLFQLLPLLFHRCNCRF